MLCCWGVDGLGCTQPNGYAIVHAAGVWRAVYALRGAYCQDHAGMVAAQHNARDHTSGRVPESCGSIA